MSSLNQFDENFSKIINHISKLDNNCFKYVLAKLIDPISHISFIDKVNKMLSISRYGILDNNPDFSNTAIVDPAGLPYISGGTDISLAGGASASIYSKLEITEMPDIIKQKVKKVLDAAYYKHDCDIGVIHVVGPNFSDYSIKVKTIADAIERLKEAYYNVFVEFTNCPETHLRLLPVSGGIFSGPFRKDIMSITIKSIMAALLKLHNQELNKFEYLVSNKHIKLCIYQEVQFVGYVNHYHEYIDNFITKIKSHHIDRHVEYNKMDTKHKITELPILDRINNNDDEAGPAFSHNVSPVSSHNVSPVSSHNVSPVSSHNVSPVPNRKKGKGPMKEHNTSDDWQVKTTTKRTSYVKGKNIFDKECRHGEYCVKYGCKFKHPPTRRKECRFGFDCVNEKCRFLHPK